MLLRADTCAWYRQTFLIYAPRRHENWWYDIDARWYDAAAPPPPRPDEHDIRYGDDTRPYIGVRSSSADTEVITLPLPLHAEPGYSDTIRRHYSPDYFIIFATLNIAVIAADADISLWVALFDAEEGRYAILSLFNIRSFSSTPLNRLFRYFSHNSSR